jgi:hypothetical protein
MLKLFAGDLNVLADMRFVSFAMHFFHSLTVTTSRASVPPCSYNWLSSSSTWVKLVKTPKKARNSKSHTAGAACNWHNFVWDWGCEIPQLYTTHKVYVVQQIGGGASRCWYALKDQWTWLPCDPMLLVTKSSAEWRVRGGMVVRMFLAGPQNLQPLL